jgi:hypothetical protein
MAAKRTRRKKTPGSKAPTRHTVLPADTEQVQSTKKRVRDLFEGWDSVDSSYFRKG